MTGKGIECLKFTRKWRRPAAMIEFFTAWMIIWDHWTFVEYFYYSTFTRFQVERYLIDLFHLIFDRTIWARLESFIWWRIFWLVEIRILLSSFNFWIFLESFKTQLQPSSWYIQFLCYTTHKNRIRKVVERSHLANEFSASIEKLLKFFPSQSQQ